MSADQLLVLVLMAAAFVVGWVSARAGGEQHLPAGIDEAADALQRAFRAYGAAKAVASGPSPRVASAIRMVRGALDENLEQVDAHANTLRAELPNNPLTEDYGQAADALALAAKELQAASEEPLSSESAAVLNALELVFRDASLRYRRSAQALKSFLA